MLPIKQNTPKSHRKSDKIACGRLKTASAASLLMASSLSLFTLNAPVALAAQIAQNHSGAATVATTHSTASAARIIVTFTGTLSPADHLRLLKLGCDVYRNFDFIHSAALSLPKSNLAKLSSLPFVKYVTADHAVTKCDDFTMEASEDNQAYASNNNLTGKGVTVAVIDSGMISGSPELQGSLSSPNSNTRILANVSMISNSDSNDQCGHGTHVAGIIGGTGYNSNGPQYTHTYTGIARDCNFVNVRVLNSSGEGVASNVISALQWCVKYKSTYNIRVVNMSLGMPVTQSYKSDPLCQAAEAAWKAGIVVVCAAGNDGRLNSTAGSTSDNYGYGTNYGTIHSPGNDPYVITVGATKQMDSNRADDLIASYSSRGPTLGDSIAKPDIVTAGNKVISVLAQGTYIYNQYGNTNGVPMSSYHKGNNGNSSWNYFTLSGTSMAAPVVAGAAALLIQQNSSLTPDTIKARLMMTADDMVLANGQSDLCSYGAGYMNIPAALASTVVANTPAMSPTLYVDSKGNVKIQNDGSLFGSAAVHNSDGSWSAPTSATIWGTGQTSLSAVYGSRALWGDTSVSCSRALWGDWALSSSSSVDASRALWGDMSRNQSLAGDSSAQVDLSSVAVKGE